MTPLYEVHSGSDHQGPLELDADTVVIGSGAGGAVVAAELAEAGDRVIVLEEGAHVAPLVHGAMRPSESLRHMWRGGGMTVAFGLGDTPAINVTMGRCVGGSSVLTGGVCFRIPEHILHRWRTERGLTEFTSHALEPCYRAVEERVHVEEVPVHMRSRGTALFAEGARRSGFDVKPMRRNTRGCQGCGRCNFGCPEGAKLSVDQSYLPRAVAHGAQIWSMVLAERVTMRGERATGVEGRLRNGPHGKPGTTFRIHAKRVVVSAGSAHTPQLLRRSGVGKNSGQLGKNVTLHPSFRMLARFDQRIEGWKGALQSAFADAFEDEGITLTGLFVPAGVLAATMPGFGPELLRKSRDIPHLAMFGGLIHDEGGGAIWPSLGREPIMTYKMAKTDRARIPRVIRLLGETFLAAGARELFPPILGIEGMDADTFRRFPFESVPAHKIECSSQHPLGSCRMGMTREHSVVDARGKVWDTVGLYVIDGSIVPTSLGVNPQLSIMTLATHLAWQLREGRPHEGGPAVTRR
jgi:choline dehydrogenase-like flavoprotein